MSEETQQQTQQQDGSKDKKKFEANMKKLVALFSGEQLFKKSKLDKDEISVAVQELVKEKKEELIKDFKTKAAALINKKQTFDAFVKEKEREMQKVVEEKMKEFNKDMEQTFAIVDKIEGIEKSYYDTLSSMSGGDKGTATTEGTKKDDE